MQENYSEFQVGNLVVYAPERNYCKIKSLPPKLILEGYLKHFYPSTIEQIDKIKITEHKLKACGFDVQHPIFIKKINNEICVALVVSSPGVYQLYKNDEEFCKVEFLHQVQNAYYKITGELLDVKLCGVQEG